MRRLIAALITLMVAVSLSGCGGAPTAEQISSTALATAPPTAQAPSTASKNASDPLSPTQNVIPYQQFPTAGLQLPQVVADALSAKQPMLLYWYDPTATVSKDQRAEVDAVMKQYRGLIDLVIIDYTAGLPNRTVSAGTTLPVEVGRLELMTAQLKVNTTPYIMFVDRYGRITARFAGFVDRKYLERETLRATQ
jgi:hypothetical protein